MTCGEIIYMFSIFDFQREGPSAYQWLKMHPLKPQANDSGREFNDFMNRELLVVALVIWSEIFRRARQPDSWVAHRLRGFFCHYLGEACTARSLMFCWDAALRSPLYRLLFYLRFKQHCVSCFSERLQRVVPVTNKYEMISDVFFSLCSLCVLIPWQMHQDALHLL